MYVRFSDRVKVKRRFRMPATNWIFQLTPVMMMMGIVLINHFVTHQRVEKRIEVESSRLRAALAAELRALLDLYDTNLDFLSRGCDFVLSARQLTPVYKGNLGRLTTMLEEDVVARLVAVLAQNEKIEAILCARTQPRNGSSYKITGGEIDSEEVKLLFAAAAREAEAACRALEVSQTFSPTRYYSTGAFVCARE
jgi:hypothetical protein